MEFLKKIAHEINGNRILRSLVLAVCGLIVLIFLVNIMLNMFTRHGQVREVPDFSGMTMEEAVRAGSSSRLKIQVNDSLYLPVYEGGIILEQTPSAGARVKSGRRIFVTVNSYNQRKAVIPYVSGYSLRQAKNNLEVAGFQIERLVYQDDIATNNVLDQRYKGQRIMAGSKVEAEIGSGITLVVGVDPGVEKQAVPRVVGYSLREAKSRLLEAGFNIGNISRDDDITTVNERDAKVYAQSPAAGSRLSYGSDISMSITLDEVKLAKGLTDAEKAAREAAAAAAKAAEYTDGMEGDE